MNKEVTIKDEMIASKCGWTPFNNRKVKGFPVGTIVNGNLVMSDGKVIVESKGIPLKSVSYTHLTLPTIYSV